MSLRKNERRQLIEGLRAVAAFYEGHPEAYYDGMTLQLCMYVPGHAAGKVLAGMIGALGECERSCNHEYFSVSKKFSEKVRLELFTRQPLLAKAKSQTSYYPE